MQQRNSFALYADLVNASGAVSGKTGPFQVVFERPSGEPIPPHVWTNAECQKFRLLCCASSRIRNKFMKAVGGGRKTVDEFWNTQDFGEAASDPLIFPELCARLGNEAARPEVEYGSATITIDETCFQEVTGRFSNFFSSFCLSTGNYKIDCRSASEQGVPFVSTLTWAVPCDVECGHGMALSLFDPIVAGVEQRVLGSQAKGCQQAMLALSKKVVSASVFMYVLFLDTNGLTLGKMGKLPSEFRGRLCQNLEGLGFTSADRLTWKSVEPVFVLLTPDGPIHGWAKEQLGRFMSHVLTPIEERKVVPKALLRHDELAGGVLNASKRTLHEVLDKYESRLSSVTRLVMGGTKQALQLDLKNQLKRLPKLEVLDVSGMADVFPSATDLCDLFCQNPGLNYVVAREVSQLRVAEVDGSFLDILLAQGFLNRVVWLSRTLFECEDLWGRIFPPGEEKLRAEVTAAHRAYYQAFEN